MQILRPVIRVHLHPFYQEQSGYHQGDLPQAEVIYERIVSLPLYPLPLYPRMTEADVQDVIQAVRYTVTTKRR